MAVNTTPCGSTRDLGGQRRSHGQVETRQSICGPRSTSRPAVSMSPTGGLRAGRSADLRSGVTPAQPGGAVGPGDEPRPVPADEPGGSCSWSARAVGVLHLARVSEWPYNQPAEAVTDKQPAE